MEAIQSTISNKFSLPKNSIWLLILWLAIIPQLILFESINLQFVFGIVILVFSINCANQKRVNSFYLLIGFLLYGIYLFVKVQTVLLFGYCFLVFFVIELLIGKINILPIFTASIIMPFFKSVLNICSFELRIFITKSVASILKLGIPNIVVEGNVIVANGIEYSVDDVCAGFSMMQLGLLITCMMIAFYQKQLKKNAKFWHVFFLLLLSVFLIVIANAGRIALTIIFKSNANGLLHQSIGLLCLLGYLIVPMVFIIKKTSKYFIPHRIENHLIDIYIKPYVMVITIATISIICFSIVYKNNNNYPLNENIKINGYQTKPFKYGVMQYTKSDILLYIKPPVPFYASSHHPSLCWRGSGYQLACEKLATINGKQITIAKLKKQGQPDLLTAYWFQHKQIIFATEKKWRWHSIVHNKQFSLINITSHSYSKLMKEINVLLEHN
jgi:exosortase N